MCYPIVALLLVAIGSGRASPYYFPDKTPHPPWSRNQNESLPGPGPELKLNFESTKGQVISMEDYPRGKRQSDVSSNCHLNFAFSSPGESALIQSAGYPEDYPNNVQSSVCFTSPSGTSMTFKCSDFNIEYYGESSCLYDFLGLGFGGDPSTLQKYCGDGKLQTPVTTAGNGLAVVFQSDYSNPGSVSNRGHYRFQCRVEVYSSGSGSTTSTQKPPIGAKCECGKRNDVRIIGGQETRRNEFPWRCYLKTNKYSFFCGCSIISNNWILTAGHCTEAVMPLQNGDVLYVVVGDHDRSTSTEAASQQIPVAEVFQHPRYNDPYFDNDVSLLRLSRPLTPSRSISPVCLPFNYASEEFEGETVTASGWGITREGGSASNTLQAVDLPVMTTQQCSPYYPGIITENMICTYQPGKDSCQGDSGGSIDLKRNGRHYAIGVVSWGGGCARQNNPGVYAKTTKFLEWIVSTASGEDFCQV